MDQNENHRRRAVRPGAADPQWDLSGLLDALLEHARQQEDDLLERILEEASTAIVEAAEARRDAELRRLERVFALRREETARGRIRAVLTLLQDFPGIPQSLSQVLDRYAPSHRINRLRSLFRRGKRRRDGQPSEVLLPSRRSAPGERISAPQDPLPSRASASPDIDESDEPGHAPGVSGLPSTSGRKEARVLGKFSFLGDTLAANGWGGTRSLSILEYLVCHSSRPTPKEVLMELLWPGSDPQSSRRSLHQAVYSLRRALRSRTADSAYVLYEDGCYMLNPELELWLDSQEFESLAMTGRHLESAGRIDEAMTHYAAADRLYRGDFLEESPYEEWTIIERQRLRTVFLDTSWHQGELLLRGKQYVDALDLAGRVLGFDPCNEEATRIIMRGYAAQGQRDLAIRQFQICEERLAREFSAEPSTATLELLRNLA